MTPVLRKNSDPKGPGASIVRYVQIYARKNSRMDVNNVDNTFVNRKKKVKERTT